MEVLNNVRSLAPSPELGYAGSTYDTDENLEEPMARRARKSRARKRKKANHGKRPASR
jgi:hypothetical protein